MDDAVVSLYNRVSPAVVGVVSHRPVSGAWGRTAQIGRPAAYRRLASTGIIVDERGFVITTDRVAHPGDSIMVHLADGRDVPAAYAGTNPSIHVAVLRLGQEGPFPTLPRSPAAEAQPPMWLAAAAHSLWPDLHPGRMVLTLTHRDAIESVKVRCGDTLETVWKVRAPFYPGNGGGALITLAGEWVGFITGAAVSEEEPAPSVATREGATSEAAVIVPAELVMSAVAEIEDSGWACAQGFLGVVSLRDRGRARPAVSGQGVAVAGVLGGSPAARFGIVQGDVILSFGGAPVGEATELTRLVCKTPPGTLVKVDLLRDGVPRTVQVALGDRATGQMALLQRRERELERRTLRRELRELEVRLGQLRGRLRQLGEPIRPDREDGEPGSSPSAD